MRRVLLLGMMLLVPVLLAVAGTLLSAPSGPPKVDGNPVELGPGPNGAPALGLEPRESPSASTPAADPDPLPTQPGTPSEPPPAPAPPPTPAPPAAPAPAPAPVPVLPPVVIDDDDDDDAGEADDS